MDAELAVIVPAYNAAATLAETLEAILTSEIAIEVVVVNDGSSDETEAIARHFAANDTRVSVVTQPNSGPTVARTTGIAETTAPLFICCDADDVWDLGFAEKMVAAMRRRSDAVLAVSQFRLIDHQGPTASQSSYPDWVKHPVIARRLHFVPAPKLDFAAASARLCFPPPAGVVVRRQRFVEAGGFAISIRRSEDIVCWIRLCQLGPFVSVADASFGYRVSKGQRSQRRGRQLGAVKAKREVLRRCTTRRHVRIAAHGGLAFYATLSRERLIFGVRQRAVRSLVLGLANVAVCGAIGIFAIEALVTPNRVRLRRFSGATR